MPAPSAPVDRPRSVVVAFWCWVVAAGLTAAMGLFTATQSRLLFLQVAGAILVVVGLALAFLAGRARKGQKQFANAAVGLSLAGVVYFVLLLLTGGGGVITFGVIMILLITGSFMSQRPTSQQWYESQGTG
jgi:hypothetical protein